MRQVKENSVFFCCRILTSLRPLPDDVGPRGGAEVEDAVHWKLGRLLRLDTDATDERAVS
jgi:hypothetical protein